MHFLGSTYAKIAFVTGFVLVPTGELTVFPRGQNGGEGRGGEEMGKKGEVM